MNPPTAAMAPIEFKPRWREEIVGSGPGGRLVFELTMGRLHVYFPDEERWRAGAPAWTVGQWQMWHDAFQQWCQRERIPFTAHARRARLQGEVREQSTRVCAVRSIHHLLRRPDPLAARERSRFNRW